MLGRLAPYGVALASTVFFFRQTLFARQLPGDWGDARWSVAVYEHWYEVWQGDESLLTIPYFYPTEHTLGMSDAYLVQGQLHSVARAIGLDHVAAWAVATIGIYLAGALGFAFLSTLTLRSAAFRCAFVTLACLSYPMIVMIGHPQLAGFVALSWIFAGIVLLFRHNIGQVGVWLIIVITPLLVMSSWYAALLGMLTLLVGTGFLALLMPGSLLKESLIRCGRAVRASFSAWYGWLAWLISITLWTLAVLIYLPARNISPAGQWEEVLVYSPRPSDLVNATAGGGGVWHPFYAAIFDPATFSEEQALGFTPLLLSGLLVAGGVGLRRLAVTSALGTSGPPQSRPCTAVVCVSGVFTVLTLAMLMMVVESGNSVFRLLWEFVPGFDTIRAPFRIQLVLYLLAIFVVVAALEAWSLRPPPDVNPGVVSFSPAPHRLLRSMVTVLFLLGLLVEMQREMPKYWSASDLAPPGLTAHLPAIRDSCPAFVLEDDLHAREGGAARVAIDAVMLSMLAEVPTTHGYSRAAPLGHPGFAADSLALIEWMRSQGYDQDVCVVSPEEVDVVDADAGRS